MTQYISYVRVSTQRQGQSGLGLEAQRAAIAAFVGTNELVAEYVEVESGKRNNRPELAKAMAHAKRIEAVLVIAKLDRLARNLAFVANLMETGVEFAACDMPFANKLMLQFFAAIAEWEREQISARTKAALAAAKARGVVLGSPDYTKLGNYRTGTARRRNAAAREVIIPARGEGKTLREIAELLMAKGISAPEGGVRWDATQVARQLRSEARWAAKQAVGEETNM